MHPPPGGRAVLALDTASPVVSVAVASPEAVLAVRTEPIGRSSARLIAMIDEVLAEGSVSLGELAGVVVLAGPGSFTGLRVGMATAMGFHQAKGVPATSVPTLPVLALAEQENGEEAGWGKNTGERRVIAVVDVLRSEWAVQEFERGGEEPRPVEPAERISEAELVARAATGPGKGAARIVGHGVGRLATLGLAVVEAGPLAPVAALAAARRHPDWDSDLLTRPLYFRPPAATPPPSRRGEGIEAHRTG